MAENDKIFVDRPPNWAGRIVAMAGGHGDTLYVACEYGLFRLFEGVFVPIQFHERVSDGLPKQTA